MSNICSQHREYQRNCKLCNTHPRELLPNGEWERMHAEAEAAGETDCKACGFTYYLTTDACPFCDTEYEGS